MRPTKASDERNSAAAFFKGLSLSDHGGQRWCV